MSLYYENYLNVLKKNYMLVIVVSMLLFLTFFIWAGFPIVIIGSVVGQLTSSLVIVHLCVSLSGGILFSLFFIPINLKVAQNIAIKKHCGVTTSFVKIQGSWIIVCSIIFELVMTSVLKISGII